VSTSSTPSRSRRWAAAKVVGAGEGLAEADGAALLLGGLHEVVAGAGEVAVVGEGAGVVAAGEGGRVDEGLEGRAEVAPAGEVVDLAARGAEVPGADHRADLAGLGVEHEHGRVGDAEVGQARDVRGGEGLQALLQG
jgi:hypothetical protein